MKNLLTVLLACSFLTSVFGLFHLQEKGQDTAGTKPVEKKRVTLELTNAPVTDALEQLFRAAGENFVLVQAPSSPVRLTLRLVDVPFEETLGYLCSLAALVWTKKGNIYQIQPGVTPPEVRDLPEELRIYGGVVVPPAWTVPPRPPTVSPGPPVIIHPSVPFGTSQYVCPRCGYLMERNCSRCQRSPNPDWNYCPYDGTRLPPFPTRCPSCGGTVGRGATGGPAIAFVPQEVPLNVIYQGKTVLFGQSRADDAIFFVFPDRTLTLQVLDAGGKILVQRRIPPSPQRQAQVNAFTLLSLRGLLGRKPQPGSYRIALKDEKGGLIGEVSVRILR